MKLPEGFLRDFRLALLFILLVELLSFCGFLYPVFADAAFLAVVALTAVLAFRRFTLACLVLLAELFIGSQGGYHFSVGLYGGIALSLRMGLFLAVFGVWAARTAAALVRRDERRRLDRPELEWLRVMRRSGLLWPYLALLLVLAFASLRGLQAGHPFADVFFDANGYAYWAVLPPLVAGLRRLADFTRAAAVLFAAVTAAVLKALFVLYVFSHRIFFVAKPLYIWIRDTRVGEITIMVGDYYRIFFQAFVFALIAVFTVALLAAASGRRWLRRPAWLWLFLVGWSALALVMSFSRSYWFGGFCGVLALLAILVWARVPAAFWRRLLALAGLALCASFLVILTVYYLPWPRKGADISFAAMFGERAFSLTGEAAANSRWNLLPELWQAGLEHPLLGSGMGTSVTYTTDDPRIQATNPGGAYTTYSFEWGYHDLWIKLGLLGLLAYGWLLWVVGRPLLAALRSRRGLLRRLAEDQPDEGIKKAAVVAGLVCGLVALLLTNIFSPYLNHPLGIGVICLYAALTGRRLIESGQPPEPARSDPTS